MLDEIDLAELQNALSDRKNMAGKINGRLETYGSLKTLQTHCDLHLREFIFADPNRLSADLQAEIASGSLKLVSIANVTNSDPVKVEATMPLDLTRAAINGPGIFALDRPIVATLNCPAILLPKLPHYLTGKIFHDGILSGNLVASGTLQAPSLSGELACLMANFPKPRDRSPASEAAFVFQGKSATISFASLDLTEAKLPFDGTIDFNNTSNVSIKLFPEARVYGLDLPATTQCDEGREYFCRTSDRWQSHLFSRNLKRWICTADLASAPWTMTLLQYGRAQENILRTRFSQTFSLCDSDGDTLHFAVPASQKMEWGERASNIFQGRNSPPATPGDLYHLNR